MTRIKSIKKRNGEIVDFQSEKIFHAIEKAFREVTGRSEEPVLRKIVDHVINDLEAEYQENHENVIPHVEHVQNVVEKTLMEEGLFIVAKAYIIYRYEHAKIRQEKKEEAIQKVKEGRLMITKHDGRKEFFDPLKLKKSLQYAVTGFEEQVDFDGIIAQCRSELYDEIHTFEIERTLLQVLRTKIEEDVIYSFIAARQLHFMVYKIVIGRDKIDFSRLVEQSREAFVASIYRGVKLGKLNAKMLLFDLEELALYLKIERDDLLKYLGAQVLEDRYYLREPVSKIIYETPQIFWMRIAMGLALHEERRDEMAKKFYDIFSTLRFIPSTPTLFHAGTLHSQLSSCYIGTVMDSLDHIFQVFGDNAQLSKWSGGLGTDWSNLRGTGAIIRGTGVESQGVIPFLKIANDTAVAINRSGKRRGAACVYLETWHYDIEEFLELRKNTGDERRRTHDINTANWVPDLFMKRVRDDGYWSLFSPDETPELHHLYGREFDHKYEEYEAKGEQGVLKLYKRLKARDLWKKMITMLFETGHPWITWKDPCNIRSPQDHVGVVHCSNLCTEITLNNSEDETAVCNLGSINLATHMKDGMLDVALIDETVTIAMRMLDNVIDLNFYPTKETRVSNMRHRPVGLGIMGFHDALYLQNVNFDSEEAVTFSDYSMEVISYYAILASSKLAKERGTYSSYRGSKWDRGIFPIDTIALLEKERGEKIAISIEEKLDWTLVREHVKQYGMRNSNCMAIAPTSNLANIAGCIPCIEPIYKNIYVKSNLSGDFIVVNSYLVLELKKLGLWSKELLEKLKYHDGRVSDIAEIPPHLKERFKEVFEIHPRWIVRVAASRGKWIDQSQSLNIFYNGKSGKELGEIYQYAWELGLKTTYYLRSLAISQVEKSTVDFSQFGTTHQRFQSEAEPKEPQLPMKEVIISSMAEIIADDAIKLCKLEDPACESCQ